MYCDMCGYRMASCTHHLVFGYGVRKLADEDHLTLRICDHCHNMGGGTRQIHENESAERLSKMLGQALFELNHVGSEKKRREAREMFMKRYGKSFL